MTDPILTARGSDWETSQGAVEIMPVAVRAAVDVCPSPAAMLAPRVVVWCTERGCRARSRRPSEEGCRRQIAGRFDGTSAGAIAKIISRALRRASTFTWPLGFF